MSNNNENDSDVCPVCLDTLKRACYLPCKHTFCQECIVQVLISEQHSSICPYCRHPVKVNEIKRKVNDTALLDASSLSICGSIYVQGGELGLASYHFESEDNCYLSYASHNCMQWPPLDDGSRPPVKKAFVNISINESERTFRGDIQWSPTSWNGDQLWSYEMHFSPDYSIISSGHCIAYDSAENGAETSIYIFGCELNYERRFSNDLLKAVDG